MGAQWKHAPRVAAANKKGAVISKLVKEIMVSAKVAGPNPEANFRLRTALEAARRQSVPRDTIDRAIKRGAGLTGETIQYELVTYEGFAPHQVPVIVECLTDNRNRTAADVRLAFKHGQLGNSGAVAWMFDRLGIIEANTDQKGIDIEEVAIEAGAQNVEAMDSERDEVPAGQMGARFYCDPSDLDSVVKYLSGKNWVISFSELGYRCKNPVELQDAARTAVDEFFSEVNDLDDVHRIYPGLKT